MNSHLLSELGHSDSTIHRRGEKQRKNKCFAEGISDSQRTPIIFELQNVELGDTTYFGNLGSPQRI